MKSCLLKTPFKQVWGGRQEKDTLWTRASVLEKFSCSSASIDLDILPCMSAGTWLTTRLVSVVQSWISISLSRAFKATKTTLITDTLHCELYIWNSFLIYRNDIRGSDYCRTKKISEAEQLVSAVALHGGAKHSL